ncbi:uncharacterized protein LOC144368614 [Ictidomys tridecemlineatus]
MHLQPAVLAAPIGAPGSRLPLRGMAPASPAGRANREPTSIGASGREGGEKVKRSFLLAAPVQPKLLAAVVAALSSSLGWRRLLLLLFLDDQPVPASRATKWLWWLSRRSEASALRVQLASFPSGSLGPWFMARASTAWAAPSPILPHSPDLATPLASLAAHWLPPHPSRPGLPPPLSPPPARAAGPFLPRSPPPLFPPFSSRSRSQGHLEPSLRKRYCSDPDTANVLLLCLPWFWRTQRTGRISATSAPASTVATAASLGAPGARRLRRGQAVFSSETPESPGQGDCCNLRWAPAEANLRKGKQMHGSFANWTRIHLPLELGLDFVKDYVMESPEKLLDRTEPLWVPERLTRRVLTSTNQQQEIPQQSCDEDLHSAKCSGSGAGAYGTDDTNAVVGSGTGMANANADSL